MKKQFEFFKLFLIIALFIILALYLYETYFDITNYNKTKSSRHDKEEWGFIPKPLNIIRSQDINISSYLAEYNLSAHYDFSGEEWDLILKSLQNYGLSEDEYLHNGGMLFHRDNNQPIDDQNITLADVLFATNKFYVFLIVHQATQLLNAHKIYKLQEGVGPRVIDNLVDNRILTQIPDSQPLVTATGWKLAEASTVAGQVAYIVNLDGLAPDEDKLAYCNILNNATNDRWSLTSTETDIIALGTSENILKNGYTAASDNFFCYSLGTAGTYNFQLVFAKKDAAN